MSKKGERMKKVKSLISFIMIFMMTISTMNIPTTVVRAENGSISKSVCGVWEGTYDGNDSSSGKVERKIRLDIDQSGDDGVIEGIATINDGDSGKYYFTGKLDLETGDISFQGKEWLYNPKDFSFTSFQGKLDLNTMKISGTADQADRTFLIAKKSDDFESLKVNTNSFATDYSGEYDGIDGSRVTRRDIELHIENIAEDGMITGTAVISPSSKEDIKYGANGSYYFKGTINKRNGKISLQGYKWIDYPVGYDNFTFVKLNGYIDSKKQKIIGSSENGIWRMEKIDYDSTETKSGFTLGKDNNNFAHSDSDASIAGFRGIATYAMDDSYFEKLTKDSSDSEKNKIKKAMGSKWNGSCYGIAMTMGLLYEDYIKINDLTDSKSANTYYSMPYPVNDKKLLNTIQYYQLSQNLENGGKKSAAVSAAYNNSIFSGLVNWLCNYDSLSVFLKKLVNYASTDHVELLGFSTEHGGHAVLVTGCEYDSANEQYKVQIYDENSVSGGALAGKFSYMTIKKDFSAFTYTDANGENIENDTYKSIYFLDWNSLGNIVSKVKKTSSTHTKFDFLLDDDFKVANDNGEYIEYKDNKFKGNMNIYSMDTVDTDNGVHVIIETDKTKTATLSDLGTKVDMEVYNDDQFLALNGKNIAGAEMKLGEDIKVKGDDYSFKAYISTDKIKDDETGLVSVSANAKSDAIIAKNENEVKVSSENMLTNLKSEDYVGNKISSSNYKDATKINVKKEQKISPKTIKNAKVKLQKDSYTYDGENKKPSVTVNVGNTKLVKDVDYKVTYKNYKNVGTATIVITGIGNYTGMINKTFKILPKGTSISKVTSRKKKLIVKWKKQKQSTNGYQIQYSTSKKFTTKKTKIKKITKNTTTQSTISKLKSKTKYYVRIRTYKKVQGKTYYSTWSKVKVRRIS